MADSGAPAVQDWQVGQSVEGFCHPPISRTTLALFAGASGDHNPIHIDIDFAKKVGLDDVFAHGMLSMAYLGHYLTRVAGQAQLRSWKARFTAITPVGAKVQTGGTVTDIDKRNGEMCVTLDIWARIEGGPETLVGEAVIALT